MNELFIGRPLSFDPITIWRSDASKCVKMRRNVIQRRAESVTYWLMRVAESKHGFFFKKLANIFNANNFKCVCFAISFNIDYQCHLFGQLGWSLVRFPLVRQKGFFRFTLRGILPSQGAFRTILPSFLYNLHG